MVICERFIIPDHCHCAVKLASELETMGLVSVMNSKRLKVPTDLLTLVAITQRILATTRNLATDLALNYFNFPMF